jgi:hypothetical protein
LRLGIVLDAPEARSVLKANPAHGPLVKFGGDVFGDKDNLGGAADEFVLLGLGLGNDEREDGAAVGRGDGDPAVTGLEAGVEGEMEAELVEIESQAAILIADENVDAVKAEMEILGER